MSACLGARTGVMCAGMWAESLGVAEWLSDMEDTNS